MRVQITMIASIVALAGAASAQTSVLYTNGNGVASAVQGGVLQNQWSSAIEDGYSNDTFAVAGTIKFVGRIPSQYGKEFDLGGIATGNTYYGPLAEDWTTWDGAGDGTHNYVTTFFGGQVLQFDADWQNPVPLPISATPTTRTGLTWDGSNNSLWLCSYGNATISNYAMDGTLLSSFVGDSTTTAALAMDPADGTLWALDYGNTPNFRQYDRFGALLNKFNVNGVDGSLTASAEFSVPAPGALALLGVGLATSRRRR